MKYSTHNWDLVWAFESASPAPCKTPNTFNDSIYLNNLLEKAETQKRDSTPNNSYRTVLAYVRRTQGQGS